MLRRDRRLRAGQRIERLPGKDITPKWGAARNTNCARKVLQPYSVINIPCRDAAESVPTHTSNSAASRSQVLRAALQ